METVIDPMAGLPADIPEDTARAHAAVLVKGGGVSLEDANRALAARNAAPLTANSRDMAEAARDALLNDSNFVTKYRAGDPTAIAELFKADLRVQQSSGKLTDRDLTPAEYHLDVAQHLRGAPDKAVLAYTEDMAKLAANLKLPTANAQSLVDLHFAAVKETAGMTEDELSLRGQKEAALLQSALGDNAEAKIKNASEKLSAIAGRPLDLSKIVQSNGASVALMLYQQAEALTARK